MLKSYSTVEGTVPLLGRIRLCASQSWRLRRFSRLEVCRLHLMLSLLRAAATVAVILVAATSARTLHRMSLKAAVHASDMSLMWAKGLALEKGLTLVVDIRPISCADMAAISGTA